MTHKSRTDRHGVFKLGSNVGHVTRHELQLFKVKRSKVKVTRSRDVKGKVFPYSLPSVGPGADPGVQAVSPQVT